MGYVLVYGAEPLSTTSGIPETGRVPNAITTSSCGHYLKNSPLEPKQKQLMFTTLSPTKLSP